MGIAMHAVQAGTKCDPGCKCVDCQNIPSARSPSSATDDHEVELEELQDDQSVRQAYNLELVDDIDDAGTESDCEQDEENLSLFEPEDDNN